MKKKWIFADWKLPVQKDLDLIEALGFTDVVLGVVLPKTNKFKPSYSTAKIVAAVDDLRQLGVRVHIMAWIYRQKTYIRQCGDWMCRICRETGAESGMLDAEKDWHKGWGISAPEAAKLVKQVFAEMPCPLGVTGLSNLHQTVKPLLEVCDYGLGQAYSIWKPNSPDHWSHSRSTEPLTQQLTSWASWSEGGKPLVMGLSNYWAKRPARFGNLPLMDARQSLLKSLEGTRQAGADEVAYWSLKWLHGEGASRKIARQITADIPIEDATTNDPQLNQPSAVQWLLVQLGYNLGNYGPNKDGIDGSFGQKSQAALQKFRTEQKLDLTGEYTLEDLTELVNALRKKSS